MEQNDKYFFKNKRIKTPNIAFCGMHMQDLEIKSINNPNLNTYSISFLPEQLRSGFILPGCWFNQRANVVVQYLFTEKAEEMFNKWKCHTVHLIAPVLIRIDADHRRILKRNTG